MCKTDPDHDDGPEDEQAEQPHQVGWYFEKSEHLACIECVSKSDAAVPVTDTELAGNDLRCDLCGTTLEAISYARGVIPRPTDFADLWATRLRRRRSRPTTPEALSHAEDGQVPSIRAVLRGRGNSRWIREQTYDPSTGSMTETVRATTTASKDR